MSSVLVGVGWDVLTTTGEDFDPHVSALVTDTAGRLPSEQHFVHGDDPNSPDGGLAHSGDHVTGQGRASPAGPRT
ncbi:TerD family protein [Streptomyces sp. NPDC059456]|uniref:TerD family protein n=1 Tax=Streptomyces sp. NPDC059456 TaxID=3346838 RepID=UPI0036A2DE17